MHVNGDWFVCEDGVIRPIVIGLVKIGAGQLIEVTFLLDAGADRTVFSSGFLSELAPLKSSEAEQIYLAGVGGRVSSITVNTTIGFTKDDGNVVTVRGSFAVFTESDAAELSVLGRDVTNNFSVIYDYPNQIVALLAAPHYYEIKKAS
ncbi:MAG TPA: hypothetical protein VKF81_17945 [Blastocatellia bacterium]|nr:hypothetical protein [Blastocatellia bacterium]